MATQLPLDLPHRPSFARDDLVVSAANRLAVEAVDAWPRWAHAVLIVVGPAGAGKTHLGHVWAERAGARIATPDTVHEIAGASPFAVVLDDIDRAGYREEDLFALVNAARLGGGSVLATASRPPAEFELALKDLRSRLCAASLVRIETPDDDLLAGVLTKLFADRQLDVEPGAVRYLTDRMERSLEAAQRVVAAADREALAAKGRITRPLLRRVLDAQDGASRHQTVATQDYAGDATEDL
ncbi:DnaA/Hda family protein [Jiella sp. M17.18]|uniref:HdaA/DnaA family protein n=1 Tax=Jiella sp. M17.18 TaxID=3234247 RepID=UPI0034DE555B